MKILNFGSCNIDYVYSLEHIVVPGETLSASKREVFPGGKGLNQSVAVARAGAQVFHAGVIGNDGAMLRAVLEESGADTRYVETADQPNGHAVIQLASNAQNSIFLYEGTNGMAGEIGHVRLTDDGPEGYGKPGSCEGYCSGGGLRRLSILQTGRDLSAKELVQLAEAGDQAAIRTLETSAQMLGRSVAILIDLFNPERIVIGSIFQRAEKWFRPWMERIAAREAVGISYDVCKVVPAQLGDAIGDIAAITIAWDGLDRRANA